jgi:type I restriction enzyme S subunit
VSESPLLKNLDLLATAPGGVKRLRELILTLAVQGKLVPQHTKDEPASELLKKIRAEGYLRIAAGTIKPGKPLAKIADDEKPFELPVGWEWERFGAIAGIERGGSPRPIQSFLTNDPDGLNWIKIGDTEMGGKYITSTSEKIRRDGLSKTRMVFAGDFLLTNSMSFGRPYITQIDGCIHDGWLRISPPTSLNKDFLYLLLSSRFIRTVFEAAASGGVVLNLNADKVRTVPIPLPPLSEQSRIVTRVEELMKLCDALEKNGRLADEQHARLASTLFDALAASESAHALAENWAHVAENFDLLLDRPEAVDALEQIILQLAVRGLLVPQDPREEPASEVLKKIRTERERLIADGKAKGDKPLPTIAENEKPFLLPVGWEWVRLSTVAEANTGFAFKSTQYTPTGTFVFRVTNIKPDASVDMTDVKYIDSIEASTTYRSFNLKAGDVLLVMVGGSLGKIGIVEASCLPAVLNQNMWKMQRNEAIDREYFVDCLRYINRHQLKVTNSTHGHLTQGEYLKQVVAIPPLAEQARIVTRIHQLRRLCVDLRQRLTTAREHQGQLAQTLVEQQSTV